MTWVSCSIKLTLAEKRAKVTSDDKLPIEALNFLAKFIREAFVVTTRIGSKFVNQ